MAEINTTRDIVNKFDFRKDDYFGAEEQLARFADSYSKLNAEEADCLRSDFQAKDRLKWLRIASTLFCKFFSDAGISRKNRLCKIFFALYSFDNLEFGFDSVMDVISVSDQMKNHADLAKKNWESFSKLTSNDAARNNLENKIYGTGTE